MKCNIIFLFHYKFFYINYLIIIFFFESCSFWFVLRLRWIFISSVIFFKSPKFFKIFLILDIAHFATIMFLKVLCSLVGVEGFVIDFHFIGATLANLTLCNSVDNIFRSLSRKSRIFFTSVSAPWTLTRNSHFFGFFRTRIFLSRTP